MEIDINILNKFKVYQADTLFDVEKDEMFFLLKNKSCIKCGNKLKYVYKSRVFMCRSKKHVKPFIIREDRLNEINGQKTIQPTIPRKE